MLPLLTWAYTAECMKYMHVKDPPSLHNVDVQMYLESQSINIFPPTWPPLHIACRNFLVQISNHRIHIRFVVIVVYSLLSFSHRQFLLLVLKKSHKHHTILIWLKCLYACWISSLSPARLCRRTFPSKVELKSFASLALHQKWGVCSFNGIKRAIDICALDVCLQLERAATSLSFVLPTFSYFLMAVVGSLCKRRKGKTLRQRTALFLYASKQ